MKSLFFTLLGLIILSSGCDKLNCQPEEFSYTFDENQQIIAQYDSLSSSTIYTQEAGENLLFEFGHSGAQCDDIFDDEWGELLRFEIDPSATEFEFLDSNIMATNCYYRQVGAWVNGFSYPITKGSISGEKNFRKRMGRSNQYLHNP